MTVNFQTTLAVIESKIERLPEYFNFPYGESKVYKSVLLRMYAAFPESEFTLYDIVAQFGNEFKLTNEDYKNHLKFLIIQKWAKMIATKNQMPVYIFLAKPKQWKVKKEN